MEIQELYWFWDIMLCTILHHDTIHYADTTLLTMVSGHLMCVHKHASHVSVIAVIIAPIIVCHLHAFHTAKLFYYIRRFLCSSIKKSSESP